MSTKTIIFEVTIQDGKAISYTYNAPADDTDLAVAVSEVINSLSLVQKARVFTGVNISETQIKKNGGQI